MSIPFEIEFLDHVAIRAKDMVKSQQWYEDVLGLKQITKEAWGPYPIMMFAGQTGIAIFPASLNRLVAENHQRAVRIDHFAFRVSNEAFDQAIEHFIAKNVPYKVQDHIYFKSVYINDPDDHQVELTTLTVPIDLFLSS